MSDDSTLARHAMSFFKKLLWGRRRRLSDSDLAASSERRAVCGRLKSRCAGGSAANTPLSSPALPVAPRVGVRAASNKHVAHVLPGLLLGSQEFAQDVAGLERYKVTHILNITSEVADSFPDRYVYKRIAISDLPSTRIVLHFNDAFDFITSCRANGGCVLVHCYYGNSRSASFVIAYLMKTEHMRYREAIEYLRLIRPDVCPNDGFERQLKVYELENCVS